MAAQRIIFNPDDRFAFVGGIGSGKTYGAGVMAEILLSDKHRCILIDPLGVWHGLRVMSDGSPGFPVVIFGGDHGDFPLTEKNAAIVGETIGNMAESCIIDLSHIGTKAGERRVMLALLTALYRHTNGAPVHMIVDEADMFAPQNPSDKDGGTVQLLSMMETIVRRGRRLGFNVWMITQRPAVLNKNVMSQVTGLIAFRMTAPQDRKAIGDWTANQGDPKVAADLLNSLPGLPKGSAVVWVPERGYFERVDFPKKATKDTSAAPKAGEARRSAKLPPLNIDALRAKLVSVEEEAKANDPAALKARIRDLESVVNKPSVRAGYDAARQLAEINDVRLAAYDAGHKDGFNAGVEAMKAAIAPWLGHIADHNALILSSHREIADHLASAHKSVPPFYPLKQSKKSGQHVAASNPVATSHPARAPLPTTEARKPGPAGDAGPAGPLSAPEMRVIEALTFWKRLNFDQPTREQVACAASYKPSSGGFRNLLSKLKTGGFINYPADGKVELAPNGLVAASDIEVDHRSARERLNGILSKPQLKIVDALMSGLHGTRDELAGRCGYAPTSGGWRNLLSSLKTLEIISYPEKGEVALADWVRL